MAILVNEPAHDHAKRVIGLFELEWGLTCGVLDPNWYLMSEEARRGVLPTLCMGHL
jgi:hypothetical protein